MTSEKTTKLSSLDRVREITRAAEEKAKSGRLIAKLNEVGDSLLPVAVEVEQALDGLRRFKETTSESRKKLAADMLGIRECERRIAFCKSKMTPEEIAEAESAIDEAKAEINAQVNEHTEMDQQVQKRWTEAKKKAWEAWEAYTEARDKLVSISPTRSADAVAKYEPIAQRIGNQFLKGRLRLLKNEIDNPTNLAALRRWKEEPRGVACQREQIRLWAAMVRDIQEELLADQATETPETTQEDYYTSRNLFGMLVEISRVERPGFLEELSTQYKPASGWAPIIARAREDLQSAIAASQEHRLKAEEAKAAREAQRIQEEANARLITEAGDAAWARLSKVTTKWVAAHGDEFRELVQAILLARGADDDSLVTAVTPYANALTGDAFTSLLRRIQDESQKTVDKNAALRRRYANVIAATTGWNAIILGGSGKRKATDDYEKFFCFKSLEWESFAGENGKLSTSIVSRVNQGRYDLVIIVKSFTSHTIYTPIKAACDKASVPMALIASGYGLQQTAEAIRTALQLELAD